MKGRGKIDSQKEVSGKGDVPLEVEERVSVRTKDLKRKKKIKNILAPNTHTQATIINMNQTPNEGRAVGPGSEQIPGQNSFWPRAKTRGKKERNGQEGERDFKR